VSVAGHRDVRARRDFGVPVAEQVDGYAASQVAERGELVAPEIAVL